MSSEGSAPVQYQPPGQNQPASDDEELEDIDLMEVKPLELQRLVNVEEAILMKNVLHTRNGKILFGLRQKKRYFGPDLDLRLMDPYKRDVVAIYLVSNKICCGVQRYLRVVAMVDDNPIGFVKIAISSFKIKVSMLKANKETMFTAEIAKHVSFPKTIEILSVDGAHPVAKIIQIRDGKSSQVVFKYPPDMEATMKVIILAAFLYLRFQVGQIPDVHSSGERDLATATTGRRGQNKKDNDSLWEDLCCWDEICCGLEEECCGECGIIDCLGYLC